MKSIFTLLCLSLALANKASAVTNILINSSFEAPSLAAGSWKYLTTDTIKNGWTFISSAGIASQGSLWVNTPENGQQVAFLQHTATASQSFTLPADTVLSIGFWAASRPGYPAGNLEVKLDNNTLGYWPSGSFGAKFTNINLLAGAYAGAHTLSFIGTDSGNDPTSIIDDVRVSPTNGIFLSINGGTGFGVYTNGQKVPIAANRIYGSMFTFWSGNTNAIDNPLSACATVTMPASNISLTANFQVSHTPLNANSLLNSTSNSLQQANILNVADYGAVGDAIKTTANTISNSPYVSLPSTSFSSADVGKVIEIYGAGPYTSTGGHQDLIAFITSVANKNTVLVDALPQATLTNAYTVCGSDNSIAFQTAVNSAGTNAIINIPAGTFLLVPALQLTNTASTVPMIASSLILTKGGLHFIGAGKTNTTLTQGGAWTLQFGKVQRGFLINCVGPITNNYAVSFENLTMDGGVQQGNTSNHGFPAGVVDGNGWDETHDAVVDSGNHPVFASRSFINCQFIHWRGEILKNVCSSDTGFMLITNCSFIDGNASAFNMYSDHIIDRCLFSNMFQISEFYQAYNSGASYFQNNVSTNITGNGIAINGATGSNPAYYIRNNTFYPSGGNLIGTTPGCNVFVISNSVFCQGVATFVAIGTAGYQGYSINSNIVVACNTVADPMVFLSTAGVNENSTATVQIFNNKVTRSPGNTLIMFQSFGWQTNVHFFSNSFTGTFPCNVFQSAGQIPLFETNNLYDGWQVIPGTNSSVSYQNGVRYTTYWANSNSVLFLNGDQYTNQMPKGAMLQISNDYRSASYPIYLSSTKSGAPVTIASGQGLTFYWNGSGWNTNTANKTKLVPPYNLRKLN